MVSSPTLTNICSLSLITYKAGKFVLLIHTRETENIWLFSHCSFVLNWYNLFHSAYYKTETKLNRFDSLSNLSDTLLNGQVISVQTRPLKNSMFANKKAITPSSVLSFQRYFSLSKSLSEGTWSIDENKSNLLAFDIFKLLVTPMIVRSVVYCRQKIGLTFDSVRTEYELNENYTV